MRNTNFDRRGFLVSGAAAGAAHMLRRPWLREERPNLLVITSDQQHWEAMGYEDPFFRTPACDALAAEAAVFRQSFCTTPQCSPSRSSMLCGSYPHKTGVMNNHGSPGDEGLKLPTLGSYLQRAGYHTVYHGKWHLGNTEVALEGWDSFRPTSRPADRLVARMTRDFLSRAKEVGKPFALFAMFLEPHGIQGFSPSKNPSVPDDVKLDRSWHEENFDDKPAVQREFLDRAGVKRLVGESADVWREYRASYRERVASFDRFVGSLLKALRDNGLWENTVIVVTSDHGDMDTHHRLVFKGPFMYEHLVRIPTLIRIPPGLGGRRLDLEHYAWVNVDLVPTLLEAAGADPIDCDGRSLLPLLRGEDIEPRPFVVAQFHGKGSWVHPIRMLRTTRYKYNRDFRGIEELYDLQTDPVELRNLATSTEHAKVKARLANQLMDWMKVQGDPFLKLDPESEEAR
ncbi:MAG: hypothetical protein CMJ89_02010 [Planctomycetes bacterium]|nr:hypothetical protein [Planctomycetota bacterium]